MDPICRVTRIAAKANSRLGRMPVLGKLTLHQSNHDPSGANLQQCNTIITVLGMDFLCFYKVTSAFRVQSYVSLTQLSSDMSLTKTLPASWFCSPELYQLERRAIFLKVRHHGVSIEDGCLKLTDRLIVMALSGSSDQISGARRTGRLRDSSSDTHCRE